MATASKKPKPESTPAPYFEEWECKIVHVEGKPVAEKLKMTSSRVLITAEQADLLNEGRIHGGNNYALLYYPAKATDPAAAAE